MGIISGVPIIAALDYHHVLLTLMLDLGKGQKVRVPSKGTNMSHQHKPLKSDLVDWESVANVYIDRRMNTDS